MNNDSVSAGSQSLCLMCGLCCDGTLFGAVILKPGDDLPALRRGGISVFAKKDKDRFTQPCAAYRGKCCEVYESRPATCVKFECSLLKKYRSGEISLVDAKETAGRALVLRNEFRSELAKVLQDSDRMSIREILKIVPETGDIAADRSLVPKWAIVTMNLAALLDHLQTHFRKPRKDSVTENELG